jgi:hypothetical protein
MKSQPDKIDDFFREALRDHSVIPSEEAKEAFLKEAATLEERNIVSRKWYIYLSAAILLLSAGAGFYFAFSGDPGSKASVPVSTSSVSNTAEIKTSKSTSETIQAEIKTTSKTQKSTPEPLSSLNNPTPKSKSGITKKEAAVAIAPVTRNEELISEPIASAAEKPVTKEPEPEKKFTEPIQNVVLPPVSLPATEEKVNKESQKESKLPVKDTMASTVTPPVAPKSSSGSPAKNWNVALGVYYAPEWMFNTLEGEKYVNNFGIEGTFHFGRYSIRTGAGLSITKGTNEVSVGYNDYLGSYQKLDSIDFNWDNTHYKYVPTEYFSNEDVWDSLMKVADAKIVKRYTYLQIPLILGYDFWQNERFSIGVRGGPIFSVLLKSEQLSENYDPGKNKVVLVNQITPERIHTNWQILGGINSTFRFSQRLGIELEPEIRYYFNSVYEKNDNNKKPWSVGIRAAFIVIF